MSLEVDPEGFAALHADIHRGFDEPLPGGNQGGGDGAGPAGEGLILHAAFVGPDAERMVVHDGREIGVRPGGLVMFMTADRPAGVENIKPFEIADEMDDMGNAGVDAVDEKGLLSDLDPVVHDEVPGIGQAELDDVAPDLGVDDPGAGLEGHLLPGDPQQEGKTGGATAAVSAHLHLGAVGVEEPPPEIDLVGRFDHE